MSTVNRVRTSTTVPVAAVVLVFAALVSRAAASTVVPMNLQTLADHAGQTIVGRVTSVRAYWSDARGPRRRIESEVTLEHVEHLKGALPDSKATFTIVVPGGAVGRTRMRICCAPIFSVGDKWVLFLLPTYQTFPVVGLYQGAFLVRPDAEGAERVYRCRGASAAPITGFDAEGFARVAGSDASIAHRRLVGANRAGLKTAQVPAEPVRAMTYQEFLAQLRPVLHRSKRHPLDQPAGRRVTVDYTAASLARAPRQQTIAGRRTAGESSATPRKLRAIETPREARGAERVTVDTDAEAER